MSFTPIEQVIYPRFEKVSSYPDAQLPERATAGSAGYDFYVAEDIVVPSYEKLNAKLYKYMLPEVENIQQLFSTKLEESIPLSLDEVSRYTKETKCKPTLVPTGVKAYIPDGMFLQLSVRSSCPLKSWLVLANGVGIIDSDYYNNPDNEGHIFYQIINLFPKDIFLHKGDKIGQGIFLPYTTIFNDTTTAARGGGFGSTGA